MARKVVNLTIKLKDGVSGVLHRIRGGIAATTAQFKAMGALGARAFRSVARAGAIGLGVLTVGALALGKAIKVAFSFETAKVQLKSLLGSMGAATKRFNELREFSARTPFQLPGILKASRLLTVFSEGALGGAKSLQAIGDAAAVAGQDISDVAFWVGRAYSMLKGGKPFGEAAMRLQEMGILTAKGRDEIEKMVKAGAPLEKTFGRLKQEMERFNGGMEDLSATGNGLISTLKDNWTIAVATFGDAFMSAAKGGITTMIETIQGLVKDGTITKWAEQAKSALDSVVAVVKILAGAGPEGARVELFKRIAEVLKAAIITAAEIASKKLGGSFDPSINTLTGALTQLTGNLASWGWEFTKDLGGMLLEAAPRIGSAMAEAFIGGARSLFGKGLTRNEARLRAQEELGPAPKFGLFPSKEETKRADEYWTAVEQLAENHLQEAIGEQKKAEEKKGKEAAKAFRESLKREIPSSLDPVADSAAGTTDSLDTLTERAGETADGLSRLEIALASLGALIDPLKPQPLSAQDNPAFFHGAPPQARSKDVPFGGMSGLGKKMMGHPAQHSGPKMMGAPSQHSGPKMMGQGDSAHWGIKMMGTPAAVRAALMAEKEAANAQQDGQGDGSLAGVESELKGVKKILDERLGAVEGSE